MEEAKIIANEDNKSYTVARFFELFQSLPKEKQDKVLCFIAGMLSASDSK